jgi:hypothetical protein
MMQVIEPEPGHVAFDRVRSNAETLGVTPKRDAVGEPQVVNDFVEWNDAFAAGGGHTGGPRCASSQWQRRGRDTDLQKLSAVGHTILCVSS